MPELLRVGTLARTSCTINANDPQRLRGAPSTRRWSRARRCRRCVVTRCRERQAAIPEAEGFVIGSRADNPPRYAERPIRGASGAAGSGAGGGAAGGARQGWQGSGTKASYRRSSSGPPPAALEQHAKLRLVPPASIGPPLPDYLSGKNDHART